MAEGNKYRTSEKERDEKEQVYRLNVRLQTWKQYRNTLIEILKVKRKGYEVAVARILDELDAEYENLANYGYEGIDALKAEIDDICNKDGEGYEAKYENRPPIYLEDETGVSGDSKVKESVGGDGAEANVSEEKPKQRRKVSLKPKEKPADAQSAVKKNENVSVAKPPLSEDAYIMDMRKKGDYDLVPLPSKGECYACKKGTVDVEMIKARDENLISSPVLYSEGKLSEVLVDRKVCDKEIRASELCSADFDAVVLFLRKTSYGPDFPVIVTDSDSGKKFDGVVDLNKIRYKEFKLKGDANGWFSYKLPVCGDEVKFKYLSRKEEKELLERNSSRKAYVDAGRILKKCDEIDKILERFEDISEDDKNELVARMRDVKEAFAGYEGGSVDLYENIITNTLEACVMSVNGNTDRDFISQYVQDMKALDSLKLRRYMSDNKPEVDFSVEVERPADLGGGSVKTFLEWDDAVFFNLA